MRASSPDVVGTIRLDDLNIGYEVCGSGDPSVLLLPTWTIIHMRFWKFQVPYLSRRHRVVAFDGPGNGRSDRTTDPDHYSPTIHARAALAVLDEIGVERVVVVGLSLGAVYALRLAELAPKRMVGLVLIGPALSLSPVPADRVAVAERFLDPYPNDARGWDKFNLAYWHDHYEDFADFFFGEAFSEPHSTKPREDAVEWAMETGADVLEADAFRPDTVLRRSPEAATAALGNLPCPLLVIHGTADRLMGYPTGVEAARLGGGSLLSMEGSGHLPNVRDPVRFNLILSDFIDRVAS